MSKSRGLMARWSLVVEAQGSLVKKKNLPSSRLPAARITAGDVLELRCSTTTALCSKKCLMYFLSGRADVYQIGVYTALHQKIKDSTAHCVLFKLGVHCAVLECVGL